MVKAATAARHAETTQLLATDVGQRIREARKARGMSLAQLGGEDLSRSFLSLVETGRSRISLRALSIVANRLGLPVSYFLSGDEDTAAAASALLLAEADIALNNQQSDVCLRLLDEAEQTSPGPVDIAARLLRGLALIALSRGRDAAQVLREGIPDLERSDDLHFRAEYRYALSKALYSIGSFDEAIVLMRQALQDSMVEPADPILMGKITVGIGHVLLLQQSIDGAIEYYHRAAEHFGTVRDFRTQGTIYSGLSLALKRKGEMQRALHYARLAASTFQASNDARSVASELNNVAVALDEQGDPDGALTVAQQALTRARQIGAEDVEAHIHSTLAAIHVNRGELDRAESEASLATSLAPDELSAQSIDSWRVLARIAEERSDLERADELYRQVLDRLKQSGRMTRFAETAIEYSKLLNRRGQTERAFELALEAAQLRSARNA